MKKDIKIKDEASKRIENITRVIDEKLNQLKNKYDKSPTANLKVLVLCELEELCLAEVDYWYNIMANAIEEDNDDTLNIIQAANEQVNSFKETISNICKLRHGLTILQKINNN